jgi:hypothetical protein
MGGLDADSVARGSMKSVVSENRLSVSQTAGGNMFRSVLKTALAAVALVGLASAANATDNLITNGGFETGDLKDWALIGAANTTNVSVNSNNPLSGRFALQAGPLSALGGNGDLAAYGGIQQAVLFPGNDSVFTFSFSFQQNSNYVPPPGPFMFDSVIGIQVGGALGSGPGFNALGPIQNPPKGPYVTETITRSLTPFFPDVALNGGYLPVSVIFLNNSSTFDIDDVSISVCTTDCFPPPPAVPEPSTWAMMLLGFAGLGFAFRQSRRKVSFASH